MTGHSLAREIVQLNVLRDIRSNTTVRYLGIEVDDALQISEQTEL